ncbi:orotidine-5'-phosphate decarboxylase [Pradoshia sp.]
MNNTPIIALDFAGKDEALQLLKWFPDEKLAVKIGMELYYAEGPSIVTAIKEMGHDVFLDLKLHDIPNTVKKAMERLAVLGADMVNVHAAGGQMMMEYALEGLDKGTASGNSRPLCIAVTQLTSTTESQMHREQLIQGSLNESVLHYGRLAKAANLDGVVCSVHEAHAIHNTIGAGFLTVTPGIRLAEDEKGDQKRIAPPSEARMQTSDFIVVGRSITGAENPREAYHTILQEWEREQ